MVLKKKKNSSNLDLSFDFSPKALGKSQIYSSLHFFFCKRWGTIPHKGAAKIK